MEDYKDLFYFFVGFFTVVVGAALSFAAFSFGPRTSVRVYSWVSGFCFLLPVKSVETILNTQTLLICSLLKATSLPV